MNGFTKNKYMEFNNILFQLKNITELNYLISIFLI